jgi:hypothetical protein
MKITGKKKSNKRKITKANTIKKRAGSGNLKWRVIPQV